MKKEAESNDILSVTSHDLKNIISILSSTWQLLNMTYSNLSIIPQWNSIEKSIAQLMYYMDETSNLRYSNSDCSGVCNINDILWALPDLLDDIYPNEVRNYDFNIDKTISRVNINPGKITIALTELLKNAFEATTNDDTIQISANIDKINADFVCIKIKNTHSDASIIPEMFIKTFQDGIFPPFNTTKDEHIGLGLTIVNNICCRCGGSLSMEHTNTSTTIILNIPISK